MPSQKDGPQERLQQRRRIATKKPATTTRSGILCVTLLLACGLELAYFCPY
jgi:hypothetical protein